MKLKARSRLRPIQKEFLPHQNLSETETRILDYLRKIKPLNLNSGKNWLKDRQTKIPQLIISLASYLFSWKLLNIFYPEQVENWFVPGSYFILISLIGLGHWYFFSFLTLRPKLSFLISITLSWLLWLKLHQFEIDLKIILLSFFPILLFMLFMFWQTKGFASKN